jgi:uncharacterized protein (TIGR03067 family)
VKIRSSKLAAAPAFALSFLACIGFTRFAPMAQAGPTQEARLKAEMDRLQGAWVFKTVEIDGKSMGKDPAIGSKIILKGSRFTSVFTGETISGNFKIDVTKSPKTLDLIFTNGPEKGRASHAIYELNGDNWKICLGLTGKKRPTGFVTKPGSGSALETFKRETQPKNQDAVNAEMAALQGEWSMAMGERGGQKLPDAVVSTGRRVVKGNDLTVTIGGQTFMKATFTVNPSKQPKTIDYTVTDGPDKGKKQLGIYELKGDTTRSCFSIPGKERPTDFSTTGGDGRSLSLWKRIKK